MGGRGGGGGPVGALPGKAVDSGQCQQGWRAEGLRGLPKAARQSCRAPCLSFCRDGRLVGGGAE